MSEKMDDGMPFVMIICVHLESLSNVDLGIIKRIASRLLFMFVHVQICSGIMAKLTMIRVHLPGRASCSSEVEGCRPFYYSSLNAEGGRERDHVSQAQT